MDIVVFPQHWSAILCILIMVGSIVIAYVKRLSITYTLIIANIAIFIITLFFQNQIIYGYGSFAGQYTGLGGLGFRSTYLSTEYFPQLYTLFTSMFIHGGFLHIFGNMFVFFFIGMAFEQKVGWKKFIIIYLKILKPGPSGLSIQTRL